jgi:uncharacterized membrane protein
MMTLSDAHRFRKAVAGICMLLAPFAFLGAAIVAPVINGTGEGTILRGIAGNPDRFYISTVLVLVGLVFLVPALLGLMHMLRERRVAYGHLGGGLALIGALSFALFSGVMLMEWQMVRGGASRGQMVSLLHRFDHTAGTAAFFWFSLAFLVGMVVLAIGLYLADAVHWSTAVVLAAGAAILEAALMANRYWLYIVATAFLLVGFGTVGRMVLTESLEDWEHTPKFRGWRAAPTH